MVGCFHLIQLGRLVKLKGLFCFAFYFIFFKFWILNNFHLIIFTTNQIYTRIIKIEWVESCEQFFFFLIESINHMISHGYWKYGYGTFIVKINEKIRLFSKFPHFLSLSCAFLRFFFLIFQFNNFLSFICAYADILKDLLPGRFQLKRNFLKRFHNQEWHFQNACM